MKISGLMRKLKVRAHHMDKGLVCKDDLPSFLCKRGLCPWISSKRKAGEGTSIVAGWTGLMDMIHSIQRRSSATVADTRARRSSPVSLPAPASLSPCLVASPLFQIQLLTFAYSPRYYLTSNCDWRSKSGSILLERKYHHWRFFLCVSICFVWQIILHT